jgi:hypothetical protein
MTLKIAGQKFGRLTAVRRVTSNLGRKAVWEFLCECGGVAVLEATRVVTGRTESCGCLRLERLRAAISPEMIGKRFGRLVVVSEAGRCRDGAISWDCLCDCGNQFVASGKKLRDGRIASCGCRKREAMIQARRVDHTGHRFGRLVVVEEVGATAAGIKMVRCSCDCGGERVAPINSLTSGKTVSCGCARVDRASPPLMPERARKYSAVRLNKRRARKREAGGEFSASEVDDLYRRQRGRCASCGASLNGVFDRDHIQPLASGGSNDIKNIQLLCPPCNRRKGAKDPIAWAAENGRLL